MDNTLVRIHIEIDRHLYNRLSNTVPYGMRSLLYRKLLAMLAGSIEKGGEIIIGAILSDQVELVYNPQTGVHSLNTSGDEE